MVENIANNMAKTLRKIVKPTWVQRSARRRASRLKPVLHHLSPHVVGDEEVESEAASESKETLDCIFTHEHLAKASLSVEGWFAPVVPTSVIIPELLNAQRCRVIVLAIKSDGEAPPFTEVLADATRLAP